MNVEERIAAGIAKARFWNHVEPIPEGRGCWEWSGYFSEGYGQLCVGPKGGRIRFGAHRLSWEIHFGEIPAGLLVCHRCDTRSCVNPAHLFLGTCQDNNHDMWLKGRGPASERGDTCALGHSEWSVLKKRPLRVDGLPRRYCKVCHREREYARRHGSSK